MAIPLGNVATALYCGLGSAMVDCGTLEASQVPVGHAP